MNIKQILKDYLELQDLAKARMLEILLIEVNLTEDDEEEFIKINKITSTIDGFTFEYEDYIIGDSDCEANLTISELNMDDESWNNYVEMIKQNSIEKTKEKIQLLEYRQKEKDLKEFERIKNKYNI